MAGRLTGKVALICGGGHTPVPASVVASAATLLGIGSASCVLFAREGAHVVVLDIDPVAAKNTVDLVLAEGGRAEILTADVTDSPGLKVAIDSLVARLGRLDILMNNVGITRMGGLEGESEESWCEVLEHNLSSVFYACKHVLPYMLKQGKGSIVNTSSLAAIRFTGYPYSSYYASKGGLNQLTAGIAAQYASKGIRANAVMPGLINTPLIYRQIGGQYSSTQAMVEARDKLSPTGKMGSAWDVAHAAVFLASDESLYVNGVCLPVDGGLHCMAAQAA
jgi:NAD(P)-dependent dehydrogenase (short-subunit alcohol dehydrogenase family)